MNAPLRPVTDPVQSEAWVARFWMRLSISCLRPREDNGGDYGIRRKVSVRYRALAWKHLARARALRDAARAAA